jgi:hypothetical protein
MIEQQINDSIKTSGVDTNKISDGYHTFGELYEHRIALFLALAWEIDNQFSGPVWKSKRHSDGSIWDGWFIMGIGIEKGKQISYHLPDKYWHDATSWVEELDRAPEFDGHTSADVIDRLDRLSDR